MSEIVGSDIDFTNKMTSAWNMLNILFKDVVELVSPDHAGEIKPEWDLVKSNVSDDGSILRYAYAIVISQPEVIFYFSWFRWL